MLTLLKSSDHKETPPRRTVSWRGRVGTGRAQERGGVAGSHDGS